MEDLLRIQNNYKGKQFESSESLFIRIFNFCSASSEKIAKNIAGCARKVMLEIKKNVQVASNNAMDIDAGPSSSMI